jgi:hypothetical protein
MIMTPDLVRSSLVALRSRFGGRAAGAWQVEGDRLVQVAFVPAPDMPVEVAEGFADATRSVDLDRVNLAIVQVVLKGRAFVAIASELPPEDGSGYWLRAFGADRSVAVPIAGAGGRVERVVSLALGSVPEAREVEAAIRETMKP